MFFQTPLIRAIKEDDLNLILWLIATGADVDQRDWSGMTALMHAVWMCRIDICHLLIDAGASVHAMTNKGRTVLDIAFMTEARRSSDTATQIFQLLLKHGATRNDGSAK